jgi:hypothetical protein
MDRQDDIWEPLLTIADEAGGDWPALARAAAVELHAGDNETESYGVLLLADMRDVLGDQESIATFDLAARLVRTGDRGPWADWWGKLVESDSDASRKSVGHQLARKLKPYGIKAHQVTVEGKNVRGFAAVDFADAFDRYLLPFSRAENARTLDRRSEAPSGVGAVSADSSSEQASSVLAFQGSENGHHDEEEALQLLKTELGAEELPSTAKAYIDRLHQRGEHPDAIAVLLSSAGYPPGPGFAGWTEYAVRATIGEVWGQA